MNKERYVLSYKRYEMDIDGNISLPPSTLPSPASSAPPPSNLHRSHHTPTDSNIGDPNRNVFPCFDDDDDNYCRRSSYHPPDNDIANNNVRLRATGWDRPSRVLPRALSASSSDDIPFTSDGKRVRQRTDSNVGIELWLGEGPRKSWSSNLISVGGGAKRPRDLSPSRHAAPVSQPKKRDSESESDNTSLATVSDVSDPSGDSDVEDDTDHDGVTVAEEEAEVDEDDKVSVTSNTTSASCASLTPSAVGEDLGNINLDSPTDVPPCIEEEPWAALERPLRPSLFPHVPPYVNFCTYEKKREEELPWEVRKHLKWKLSTITPLVIRQTLSNSGFRLVRKTSEWAGTWGKHMKSVCFKTLKDFQKINHFPGTFQIGRKDRLWKNLHRLMLKFGMEQFGFTPKTYILPQDTKQLRATWDLREGRQKWIVKPPASARGTGIKVVNRWAQVPKKRPLIVQRYLSKPLLINGSKFDLRLYVLVTSFNPLRIYLYEDGLVRFASVKYSTDLRSIGDKFMHLTNYSINKTSSHYSHNTDAEACRGHKWTVKALWRYMEQKGLRTEGLRTILTDMIIKTVISAESSISSLTANNSPSRYCCYELFGFDVLIDDQLKPWLLEVNISPSLHSATPLDLSVKGPMVRDVLNMARFQVPPGAKTNKAQQIEWCKQAGVMLAKLDEPLGKAQGKLNTLPHDGTLVMDRRLHQVLLSRDERLKQSKFTQRTDRKSYIQTILEELTPDDVRHLIEAEDELIVAGRFSRIFPTSDTHTYFPYFETVRYYNMLMDAWENKYHRNREAAVACLQALCKQKLHLRVCNQAVKPKSYASPTNQGDSKSDQSCDNDKKEEEEAGGEEDKWREEDIEEEVKVQTITRPTTTGIVTRRAVSATMVLRRSRTAIHPARSLVTLAKQRVAPHRLIAGATRAAGDLRATSIKKNSKPK